MDRLRNIESCWEHTQHLGTLWFAICTQQGTHWPVMNTEYKGLKHTWSCNKSNEGPRLTHKRPKLETFDQARASDVYFFVRWLSFSFNNPLISSPAQNVFESEEIGRFARCQNCVNASPPQWLGFTRMSTKILGHLEFVSTVVFHSLTFIIDLLS